jgi:multiple sugar transport system substrate-binding protein
MKTKKVLALILSVLMVSFVFAGCGSSPAANSNSNSKSQGKDENVTLTYALWDKNQEPTIRKMADAFEAENPNIKIKIELTPWDQYWTKLETAATGGALADILWMNGPNVAKYVNGKMLLPLDDFISKDNYDMSNFPQSLVDLYTVSGKKYGMPKGFDTIGLWYNKKIFDDAKIPYPDDTWNWDKLVEVSQKLTDKSKGIYGMAAPCDNQSGYYNTILQQGGFIISDDRKTSGFDKPETIAGIQVWIDLINKGISPTLQQMTDTLPATMFESNKLAMLFAGSWMASEFTQNENIKDHIDIAVMPQIQKRATVIHGLGNAISAKTKYPDAAWKFVSWLGGKEANEMQAKAGIDIPAYKPALQIFTDSNKTVNLKAFTDELDYSVMYPCSQQTAKWQQIENDTLKKAWDGQITAEEACKTIAAEMNKILATEK